MATDLSHQIREKLADVLLALQMLARPSGIRERHRRIAELGLLSARKLAQLLQVDTGDAPRPGERPT